MADLHRQLQEYLAQGKAGGLAATEPLLAAEKVEKPAAGGGPAGMWLGRADLRWTWARSPAEPTAAASSTCFPSVTRTQRLVAALGATLYAALGLRSTLFTALGACVQVAALLAVLFGLLPRGAVTALRLALGRLGPGAGLTKALPV
ncbi:vesicle transport protein SFT2C [Suricata suricatta]|uniref:vesicle transport protein SFT2C n=1 Tax=Suricata suricatta TaxID=37032 RepID=UPI001155574D|nr:vesicle transport protein SFT2C [Suricata suricatta]